MTLSLLVRLVCGVIALALCLCSSSAVRADSGDSPCLQGASVNASVAEWFEHLLCRIPRYASALSDLGLIECELSDVSPLRYEDEFGEAAGALGSKISGSLFEVSVERTIWCSSTQPIQQLAAPAALLMLHGERRRITSGDSGNSDLFLKPGDRVLGFIARRAFDSVDSGQPRPPWQLRKALVIQVEGYVVISEVSVAWQSDSEQPELPEFGLCAEDIRHFSESVPADEIQGDIEQAAHLMEAEYNAARAGSTGVD